MSNDFGMVVTGKSLAELAERIVEGRKVGHSPTAYDYCPCCGYEGVWPGSREGAIAEVLAMLNDALA